MKIRGDFVTNSSSSSFILAFKDKEDGLSQITAMTHQFGSDYVGRLLSDFNSEEPISYDEIKAHCKNDFESDADYIICFGNRNLWSIDSETFKNKWEKEHPNAAYSDFFESREYKEELQRLVDKFTAKLLEKIGDRRYLVELEYEDHTDVGSSLEHDILPNCSFTVEKFNHH